MNGTGRQERKKIITAIPKTGKRIMARTSTVSEGDGKGIGCIMKTELREFAIELAKGYG